MNDSIQRGDIWFFDPDPTIGREQKKLRPCLILSVTNYNNGPAGLLIILPLTTRYKGIKCHIEVHIEGLTKTSYIMCDQIRSISKERLRNPQSPQKKAEKITTVNETILDQVEYYLRVLLGFKL